MLEFVRACAQPRVSERAPPRHCAPRPRRSGRLPGLLPPAGQAEAGRCLGLGFPGAARRPGERQGWEGAPGARVGVREGARGSGQDRQEGRERSCGRAWKGVCARWTGCERAAARESGKVCLGGERRGQAGRQQLWRRVGRVWRCARSRAERFLQDALPALLSGATGRRVWSRARGRESGRSEPGTGRALMDWVRRRSCSRPWASVSRPVRGDGRPGRSHVLSARTPCAQKPAAGGSLTLAAALYSGKCGGLPERPLRSQVAGGEASGKGGRGCGGEEDARGYAASPGSVSEPGWWEARLAGSGGARAV